MSIWAGCFFSIILVILGIITAIYNYKKHQRKNPDTSNSRLRDKNEDEEISGEEEMKQLHNPDIIPPDKKSGKACDSTQGKKVISKF